MISKLKYKIASIALGLALFPIGIAGAQGGVTPVPIPPTFNIPSIIDRAMNWAFGLLIVLAAAFILFAAFIYLTAAGNTAKIDQAKNYIIYAIVAIIVGFAARGLVFLVRDLLQA